MMITLRHRHTLRQLRQAAHSDLTSREITIDADLFDRKIAARMRDVTGITPDDVAGPGVSPGERVGIWRDLSVGPLIAVHLLRLYSPDLLTRDILNPLARTIDSTDRTVRFDAGRALRRESVALADRPREELLNVVRWFTAGEPDQRLSAAGELGWLIIHRMLPVLKTTAAQAWMSSAARHVLAAHRSNSGPGRLPADVARTLGPIVQLAHDTELWTKTDLAAAAGISRPTLNAWLELPRPRSLVDLDLRLVDLADPSDREEA